jgi:phosphate starvation-inducible PhoH-like protein
LVEAVDVISGIPGTAFVYFNERDVVRHSLVQRIIQAYEAYDVARGVGQSRKAAPPMPPESEPR